MDKGNAELKFNIVSLIELYRFISVFLTVFIYMFRGVFEHYTVPSMLFLVLCVIISTLLLNYLYKISFSIRSRLHLLLVLELAGISFLILFTGGLNSPFIWCFLNPLLIISCYMQNKQKALYLSATFLLLCIMGYLRDSTLGIREYLLAHSNIILSYLLILILVNILFYYNDRIVRNQEELKTANEKLISSNRRIKGMIQDILLMYEAVQAIPGKRDMQGIVKIILDFAGRISPEANAFFILNADQKANSLMSSRVLPEETKTALLDHHKRHCFHAEENQASACTLAEGLTAVCIKVVHIREYGVLGLLLPEKEYLKDKNEFDASLLLFSQLGAAFFEKIEADAVSSELAIADEQNRIADDIHDSVVQRLFAMSCFTHDIINKWDQVSDKEKREQIILVKDTIQSSLKDLRSTIYNLSNKKKQIDLFAESIAEYLADMERLSQVKIHGEVNGEFDSFSVGAKKALYRIITECTGNAIKHAKCKNIWVDLRVEDPVTHLIIRDDGTGLDIKKAEQEKNGLGLYNIKSLVRIFNGNIDITAEEGRGTTFTMVFKNQDIIKKLEE